MDKRLRILDTDILTLWQEKPEQFEYYLRRYPSEQLATTVVTVYEQLRGWFSAFKDAKDSDSIARISAKLLRALHFFCKINVLPFDTSAAAKFDELTPQLRRKVGTMDSRIAAIVLTVEGVLVTRNRRDFSQVPNLAIEDWITEGNWNDN